jgi:hypothetical protein
VVPAAYTLFAVALGLFAGTVLPRVLPAMALTLTGFAGVRLAVALFARPHYAAPITEDQAIGHSPGLNGAWVLAKDVRQADGTVVTSGTFRCPSAAACGLRPGTYNHQVFQPADRFWTFQAIEAGIFVLLAALLVWLVLRRIRRIA